MSAKHILIIDDEADIREIARISLEITTSWRVMTAASGQEGMQLAIQTQPDAILLDVMMPDMDGVETLKQLQTHSATQVTPIIMLTATAQAPLRQLYTQTGARAVLQKPFDPAHLGAQIADILDWN